MLPVLATLTRLDSRLLEAAAASGAPPLAAVRTVVIPLALPGIVIGGVIIVFAIAAGSFVIPALLGGLGDSMLGARVVRALVPALHELLAMHGHVVS